MSTDIKAKQKGDEASRIKFALLYAELNKELENSLADQDKIVFLPVEDFEDKAPLEDFLSSQKNTTV